jgi:hypothetical protein
MKTRKRLGIALIVTLAVSIGWAQNQTNPLTDNDIIRMTTSGLGESTILAVMQASPANFDISPNALIAMKSAGVTQNVINAVVAAGTNKSNSPVAAGETMQPKSITQTGSSASVQPNPAEQLAQSKEPSVVMMPPSAPPGFAAAQIALHLPVEKTQLTQTKTKSASLGGLANDSATTQAMQAGANTAATEGLMHSGGSMLGGIAAGQAGGLFGTVMSRRKASMTYLWSVPGPASPTQAFSNQPRFSVNFAGWMYVNLDEFEPVIVKLTPTAQPSASRLVGASQGKEDAYSSSSVDWQAFSNFVQDQAPTQVKKTAPGVFEVFASMPLEAGEYGIVLRPISKTMKFSGADVARNQGNGKAFNSVWSFEVK